MLKLTLAVAVGATFATSVAAQAPIQVSLPTQAAHTTAAAVAADYEVWHDARCTHDDFPKLRRAATGECHILVARDKQVSVGQTWDSTYVFLDADGSVARTLRVAFVDSAQNAKTRATKVNAELSKALGKPATAEIPLPGRSQAVSVWDVKQDQVRLGVAPIDEGGQQILVLQAIRRN